jgi:hypothetical protein
MWRFRGQTLVRGGLYALYESIGKEPFDDDTFALALLIPLVLNQLIHWDLFLYLEYMTYWESCTSNVNWPDCASMVIMVAHYSAK